MHGGLLKKLYDRNIVKPVLGDHILKTTWFNNPLDKTCRERPPVLGDHILKTTWFNNPLDKTCRERPPVLGDHILKTTWFNNPLYKTCRERLPVLRDHISVADGAVSQDRFHCILSIFHFHTSKINYLAPLV